MLFPRQQVTVKKAINYLRNSDKRPGVIVAPTAYGKSHVIAGIAEEWGQPVLIIQPGSTLLEQNMGKYLEAGGVATIYSASKGVKEASRVTFATLGSIKDKAEIFKRLGVRTVIVDECDHGYSAKDGGMFKEFLRELKPSKVIGLTATPFNLVTSRDRMGDNVSKLVMLNKIRPAIFKHFIDVVQIQEVIADERWTPLVYITPDFDTGTLRYNTSGSDYTAASIKMAVEANGVNNNMYLRLKELLQDPTKNILVFVDSVENGRKFATLFDEGEVLCDETSAKDKEAMIKRFKDPKHKTRVIFNHSMLTTGFDFPALNHIMIGRPSNSLRLIYQIVGRVVRLFDGKLFGYVEDFCGNIQKFGYIEDITIEDNPKVGWAAFNGEDLLTGVRLDLPVKQTKSSLAESLEGSVKMTFGKYKGIPIKQLGRGYLEYLSKWIDGLDNISSNLQTLRREIRGLTGN